MKTKTIIYNDVSGYKKINVYKAKYLKSSIQKQSFIKQQSLKTNPFLYDIFLK